MRFHLHYKAKSNPSFVVTEMMMVDDDNANEDAKLPVLTMYEELF